MLHKLRNRAADQKGFTLIELLVVVLIIGILAAIAIPSFLSQRDKANDSSGKSAARTAQTAAETFLTDSPTQNYAGMDAAKLQGLEVSLKEYTAGGTLAAPATFFAAPSGTGSDGYGVSVKSKGTGNVFTIQRAGTGTVTRTCTVVSADKPGGCQGTNGTLSGTW